MQERDFAGTPYVPIYVMLPVSFIILFLFSNWMYFCVLVCLCIYIFSRSAFIYSMVSGRAAHFSEVTFFFFIRMEPNVQNRCLRFEFLHSLSVLLPNCQSWLYGFVCHSYVFQWWDWQLGIVSMNCELVDPEDLMNQLRILKSVNVDGVMVDCWWGIVEAHAPQVYNWSGYRRLFQIVRDLKLKLQVSSL